MGTSNYSDDFKRDVVHQIAVREVSRHLGVSTYSLYKWMKLFAEPASNAGGAGPRNQRFRPGPRKQRGLCRFGLPQCQDGRQFSRKFNMMAARRVAVRGYPNLGKVFIGGQKWLCHLTVDFAGGAVAEFELGQPKWTSVQIPHSEYPLRPVGY